MADANDPADQGFPNPNNPDQDGAEDQSVEEDQSDSIDEVDRSLIKYLEYWHNVFCLIIHRGVPVLPRPSHHYPPEYRSNQARPAPFPFNMEATWYCGALLALILTIHSGFESGWLYDSVFPAWIGRVLGRALLTLGISIFSTIGLEVVGNVGSTRLVRATDVMYLWLLDRRGPLRLILQGLAIFMLDNFLMLLATFINHLSGLMGSQVLAPTLYFLFSIPTDFVISLPSWLALPTPGYDEIREPRAIWQEHGVPAIIQLTLVVFLWGLRLMYMMLAERIALHGYRRQDPKMEILAHLVRATAMHLIAYTAYQIVCGIMVALEFVLPQGSWSYKLLIGPLVPFLGRLIPNGRLFAAGLLLFFHWLLRAASLRGVRLTKKFWIPYLLWFTDYSDNGINAMWGFFVEIIEEDLVVFDTGKRVTSRVIMTALFGLQSSWPARFHLSDNHFVEDTL